MSDSQSPELPEDQLPHEVVAALRRSSAPGRTIPETLESQILADADVHLSRIPTAPARSARYGTRRFFTWSTGTIVAAMLLFALWPVDPKNPEPGDGVAQLNRSTAPISESLDALLRGDVDRNGSVNILDAFALARDIESGNTTSPKWDQNGDGTTDQLDIDLIAQSAVML